MSDNELAKHLTVRVEQELCRVDEVSWQGDYWSPSKHVYSEVSSIVLLQVIVSKIWLTLQITADSFPGKVLRMTLCVNKQTFLKPGICKDTFIVIDIGYVFQLLHNSVIVFEKMERWNHFIVLCA